MKKLLLFLLLLPLAKLNAQDIINTDIAIELIGGSSWGGPDFRIIIEQKGKLAHINYRLREDYNVIAARNDSSYKLLQAKYDIAADMNKKRVLSEKMMTILEQKRTSYQDSVIVKLEPTKNYTLLLNYIASANETAFDGGHNTMIDADFLIYKITYKGKTKKNIKSTPLSVDSPLLYALLNETLKIGREARFKSVTKIDEVFKYLF
jgi:hypothetical protein